MICQRDGCENTVPATRRKYCGAECARIMNRIFTNEWGKVRRRNAREQVATMSPQRKKRVCLGLDCGRLFWSEGPWNRMCRKCKDKRERLAPDRWR